jgi:hypothetical protein
MVSKDLRWFIVFALALAIPLQGLAAVTGGLCMAMGHHRDSAGHSHSIEHVQTESSGVHGLHNAHSSTGHTHSESDHSPSHAHCAPCVACCAATAIAPSAFPLVPDEAPASTIVAASISFTGVSPDQLYRPPLAL